MRWKYRTAGTPTDIVRGDSTIFSATFLDEVVALNLSDGSLRWKFATGASNPECLLPSAPVVLGSRVFLYMGTSDKQLLRISTDDGQPQSVLPLEAVPVGRILVSMTIRRSVFLENHDSKGGNLISTDTKLSHIRWNEKSQREWSSEWPRLWNGLLLTGNCQGKIQAFRMSDGAPQWNDTLKGCLRSIGTDGTSDQV